MIHIDDLLPQVKPTLLTMEDSDRLDAIHRAYEQSLERGEFVIGPFMAELLKDWIDFQGCPTTLKAIWSTKRACCQRIPTVVRNE